MNVSRIVGRISIAVVMAFSTSIAMPSLAVEPTKRVAITIDDLPGPGPIEHMQSVNDLLTGKLQKHHIPVTGFVNESFVYKLGQLDSNVACLKLWVDRGMDLGNHTFSHMRFKDHSLFDFEAEIVKGETITRLLLSQSGKELKYFRYPYLDTGSTPELKKQCEDFLSEHHYTIAPVSLGIDDWNYDEAYGKALSANDPNLAHDIVRNYLNKTDAEILKAEAKATRLEHRQFPLIFLCHCRRINADHLDELVQVFQLHGYEFISLSDALSDEIYHRPDPFVGDSGLGWLERLHHAPANWHDHPVSVHRSASTDP